MDEYIKREDALKAIQNVRDVMSESMIRHLHVPDCVKSLCEEVIDASKRGINRIPTADVVPKSEVELLEREVRLLTENSITVKYPHCVIGSYYAVLTKSLEDYEKVIADISSAAKAEVIEEIEKEIDSVSGLNFALQSLDHFITELKKKYTEESQ